VDEMWEAFARILKDALVESEPIEVTEVEHFHQNSRLYVVMIFKTTDGRIIAISLHSPGHEFANNGLPHFHANEVEKVGGKWKVQKKKVAKTYNHYFYRVNQDKNIEEVWKG
jgi:hypothetical protein